MGGCHDQTDNANNGTINGDPQWVKSDAPIGDHPGIRRTSFQFAGRTIASGLTALLYHQQETAAAGYSQEEKPIKRNARVMLATATGGPDPQGQATSQKYIAALDFAVSREGKLAQVPDNIDLKKPLTGSLNEVIQRLQQLEQQESDLKANNISTEQEGISAQVKQARDQFGYAVAIDGNKAIVGTYSGNKAYIFQLQQGNWTLQATLTPPQGTTQAGFSSTVAISGNTAIVGHYRRSEEANKVYIYQLQNNGTWNRETLDRPTNSTITGFGRAVAIDNNTAIIGGVTEAFIYQIDSNSWIRLPAPEVDQYGYSNFGTSVAISGDKVVVGAGFSGGRAYIYQLESGNWNRKKTLQNPGNDSGFGSAVAISGEAVIVGNYSANSEKGKAYIYQLETGTWNKTATLEPRQNVGARARFGYAVAISGNTAIVGAYQADYSGANNPGEVYVFQLNNGSWTEQRILRISNPSTAYLGQSVALSNKTALVGAPSQNANGVRSAGQAYVYNVLSLIDIEAEIKRLKAIIANGLALPMHLLNTDPFGLTVAGGLLGFASTNNPPQLFNSATGKLALYFRSPSDKFSVAYYDTNTSKVQRQLHTQYDVVVGTISSDLSGNGVTTLSLNSGSRLHVPNNSQLRVGEILLTTSGNTNKGDSAISINSKNFTSTMPKGTLVYWVGGKSGILTFVARSAEPEMDQASIQVSGTTAETCNVTITNPKTGINETWNEVPRNVTQFAAVLNGTAKKQQYVGTLAANWSGGSTISLVNIPKRRLQTGNTLLINGTRLQVGTISGNPTTTVPITNIPSSPPTIVKDTSVYFIGNDYYNYRTQASTNRPTDSLEQGSLQFIVVADPAKGKVQNGNTAGGDTSLSCAWVTESPGNALSFDGTDDYVSLADASKLSQFDAEGDITLEAWVNPSAPENTNAVGNTARVIVHKSGDSQYTLGLKTTSTSPERYTFYAGVGSLFKQSQLRLPYKNSNRPNDEQWAHLAAVYNQSYAVKFDGTDDYLSCNHNPALDISQDLTIEAFLQLEDLSQQRGIITKGKLEDGTDQQVPYSLYVNTAGKLVFAFEDKDGEFHSYESTTPLQAGTFYRIAVTRKHELETEDTGTQQAPNVVVKQWTDIRFYIGTLSADHYLINETDYHKYTGSDAGSSNQTLEIGRTQKGSQQDWFKGEMSEVRIWNQAVAKENLGITIKGEEKGLISWWRFEENKGQTAYDSKSQNHAALIGATWLKNPDLIGSTFVLYYNGEPVATEDMATKPNGGIDQFTLGACQHNNSSLTDYFKGTMEEIRVWKVPRTQEQILDNLFTRLKGEKEDLIANYTFDIENPPEVEDYSLFGNHLTLGSGNSEPSSIISKAPISDDIAQVRSALAEVTTQFQDTIESRPAIQEYSDMQYDSEANLMGIQKRCYAYIKNNQWHLLAGYKVGNLVTEWVAQVQADPQIIGYIEGAPPVPSENLTSTSLVLGEAEDYGGASSVELIEPETVNYIYSSSSESGFDTSMSMKAVAGMASDSEAGFGLMTSVEQTNVTVGFAGNMDSSTSQLQESSVSYGRSTTKITRQELSGAWENKDNTAVSYINPAVGRRFIPNNVGLALVQSDTMDVFALRLKHNNALVSYRMLPNPDIPKDWNLIVFPLNPTYTKQGTLDGKVGVKEDGSVQCDPDYSNAANYGEWSYFKPKEAYALKKQIEREQQELETYYQQYATEQGTGAGTGAGIGAGVGAAVGAAVAGPIELVIGAAAGGAIGSAAGGATTTSTDIPKDIAKRNLVNTYVWTAKGGFFSESTEVMESTSESSTGSYSFQGLGGITSEFNTAIAKVAIGMEMDALFGGHTETIKTKDKETEKSFTLELEVNPDGDLQLYVNTDAEKRKYTNLNEGGGAYDAQGKPILRPGKVDAYRFMTFYLEPKPDNFDDFFGKVVDPIWLEQSGDSYAVALRQAKEKAQESQKKPECWRIMHRVTFVSRILPEVHAQGAPPVESAIRAAYVESNWELIQKLKPFVENQTSDYVTFADTVRDTLQTYLPELLPHTTEIIKYAALYFGVEEEV